MERASGRWRDPSRSSRSPACWRSAAAYLVWLWLREGRAVVIGVLGAFLLILYGVVPTLQPAHFGRVYAAYGGVFVVLSLLWGWRVDGHRPDVPEIAGSTLCLVGVAVIMYWPRSG